MFATFRPRLLAPSECDEVQSAVATLEREPARVEGRVDGTRQGSVAWIEPSSATQWLYDRIGAFARFSAGQAGLDVNELGAPLQVALYGPGSRFDWHIDTGRMENRFRKVTVSVQLSAPGEYEGGDLDLVGHRPGLYWRMRGSAVAFASILGHRVTPITRGQRVALVGWMEGPPYR